MVKTEVLVEGEVIWKGDARNIYEALESANVEVLSGDEDHWHWELNERLMVEE